MVPLLQEYFYNDMARLRAVLGGRFVRAAEADEKTVSALGDYYDADQPKYEVNELEGEAFLDALKELAGSSPGAVG